MSAKLFLRVEWNETFRTCRDPFAPKKISNFGPEILVEWIAPMTNMTIKATLKSIESSLCRVYLFFHFKKRIPKTASRDLKNFA